MLTEERTGSARVWGWLSGLGWFIVPWIAGGIVSTFLPDPEGSFPVVFGVAFVAMTGWLIFGSIRIPGFRPAAMKGAAVAVAIAVLLVALLRTSSPS